MELPKSLYLSVPDGCYHEWVYFRAIPARAMHWIERDSDGKVTAHSSDGMNKTTIGYSLSFYCRRCMAMKAMPSTELEAQEQAAVDAVMKAKDAKADW